MRPVNWRGTHAQRGVSRRFVQPGWNKSLLHENLPLSVVANVRMRSNRSSAYWTSSVVQRDSSINASSDCISVVRGCLTGALSKNKIYITKPLCKGIEASFEHSILYGQRK